MQVRTVLTAWTLTMVTLVLVALVSANWYERKVNLAGDIAGFQAELADGWEPTPYAEGNAWYWRRPRLYRLIR